MPHSTKKMFFEEEKSDGNVVEPSGGGGGGGVSGGEGERGLGCERSGGRWWSDQWGWKGWRCPDWVGGRGDVVSLSLTDHDGARD